MESSKQALCVPPHAPLRQGRGLRHLAMKHRENRASSEARTNARPAACRRIGTQLASKSLASLRPQGDQSHLPAVRDQTH